jgi:hypothetical protein
MMLWALSRLACGMRQRVSADVSCRSSAGRTHHGLQKLERPQPDREVRVVDAGKDDVLVVLDQVRVGRHDVDKREEGDVLD